LVYFSLTPLPGKATGSMQEVIRTSVQVTTVGLELGVYFFPATLSR
jgi:hypothetical protein